MADYRKLVPFLLRWEGGWADDKDDKGGKTNRGITFTTYKALAKRLLSIEPTIDNFKQLTKQQAALFVKYFWDKATANNRITSQKVSEAVTTWRWGSGSYGLKEFQRLLNAKHNANLVVDGNVGPKTAAIVNKINPDVLFKEMLVARKSFFERLAKRDSSQMKFLKGWVNRLNSFASKHNEVIKTTGKVGIVLFALSVVGFFL